MDYFIVQLGIVSVWTAVLSYGAFILKQPILIAYVLGGFLVGPSMLGFIQDVSFLSATSRIGITLLLFLAGAVLHPRHLLRLFRDTSLVTLGAGIFSFAGTLFVSLLFGFSLPESLLVSAALAFSSTLLVVKLLPTTKLHHAKIGEISIGILVLQDLLAIGVLVFLKSLSYGQNFFLPLEFIVLKFFGLFCILLFFEQQVLRRALAQTDKFHELIFVFALAWCFGAASCAQWIGLSYEIGAFLAGVALARHPISLFITEKLKPLRDFFLVLFFFVLGAQIKPGVIQPVFLGAIVLAVFICLSRPFFYILFFRLSRQKEKHLVNETSIRLGQASEFALLIAILAQETGKISLTVSQFIQIVTILTMIFSTYLVVFLYPTPLGIKERLFRD